MGGLSGIDSVTVVAILAGGLNGNVTQSSDTVTDDTAGDTLKGGSQRR